MSSSPSSIKPSINHSKSLQQTLTTNPKSHLSSSSNFNTTSSSSNPITTLAHLPRKPTNPNLRIHHPSNPSSLNSSNLSSTNPSSSPTSFNKTGLGFGRIGLVETPMNHQIQTTNAQSAYNNESKKKPFHHHLKPSHHSPPTTRRLGSFNSLASLPILSKDSNKLLSDDLIDQPTASSSPSQQQQDLHPLRFEWVFWILHRSPNKKMNEEEFGKAMKRLGSCNSVETFYPLYLHLKRPSLQTPIADIHLFSNPIKPVWEDPNNVKGGKWTIRLRKGLSDRLWESLVFSLIGGGIEKLINSASSTSTESNKGEEGIETQEICGAVLSIRKDEDLMTVWHRNGDNQLSGDGKIAKKVKLAIQTVLQLPLNCNLVYKLNADSLANGVGQKLTISTGTTITTTTGQVGNQGHSRLQQQRSLNRKRESLMGTGGGGGGGSSVEN